MSVTGVVRAAHVGLPQVRDTRAPDRDLRGRVCVCVGVCVKDSPLLIRITPGHHLGMHSHSGWLIFIFVDRYRAEGFFCDTKMK